MGRGVKVKICGITNIEDAKAAADAGADALGFVFYKKSPRYIAPKKAGEIISKLPKKALKVGVFVNAPEKIIKRIAKLCNLDMLQLHGSETPELCQRLKGYKIIKAFRVKSKIGLKDILKYKTFAYLFDAFSKSKAGGTGKGFNWELIANIKNIKHPVFLSGGLNESNVVKAIRVVHPDWIDASSSLELYLGKKDILRLRGFIKKIKGASVCR